jgi:hypothetical protein
VVGEAERQVSPQKGRIASQEIHWTPPDERSHAEEIIGDDEGKVGGEEEGVGYRRLCEV